MFELVTHVVNMTQIKLAEQRKHLVLKSELLSIKIIFENVVEKCLWNIGIVDYTVPPSVDE